MGVDLLLRQVLGELAQQSSTDSVGVGSGLAIHVLAEAPILLAGEFERQAIGQHLRRAFAIGSCDGADTTQVGVRCTMVTCSARSVMAGTRVIAVAPTR